LRDGEAGALGAEANAAGDEHVLAPLLVPAAERAARDRPPAGPAERSHDRRSAPADRLRRAKFDTRALPLASPIGPRLEQLVAHRAEIDARCLEHARRHARPLGQHAEQDVLGADRVVTQREGLAQRELEHLLRPRREGDVPGGRDAAGGDLCDAIAQPGDGELEVPEGVEHAAGIDACQREQEVLGADGVVAEDASILLRAHDHSAGVVTEPLEHATKSGS
jgi:hypothetical protein